MYSIRALLRLLAACVPAVAFIACPAQAQTLINSFETAAEVSSVQSVNAEVASATTGVTQGSYSLEAGFPQSTYGKITVPAPGGTPWNWSGEAGLAMDITNPSNVPISLVFRVDDVANPSSTLTTDYRSGHCIIEPYETLTYILPFNNSVSPLVYGVADMPYAGMICAKPVTGGNPFDPSHIYDYSIGVASPADATVIYIDNVRTVAPVSMTNIADQYGQYTGDTFSGQITSQTDFASDLSAEETDLADNPKPSGLDQYGGWLGGPTETATGWFRTQQISNKWWLITPSGHLFFALGMDMTDNNIPTFTTDRTSMFELLPSTTGPMDIFYGTGTGGMNGPVTSGTTYDFYGANLYTKYGSSDYVADATSMAVARLNSWGFNTLGNQSSTSLYGQGIATSIRIDVTGNFITYPTGTGIGVNVPDPWDPNYLAALQSAIDNGVATEKSDPYLIGWYVDNEMAWGGTGTYAQYTLGLTILDRSTTTSYAKQQFLTSLQTEYPTIAALNAAWGTTFASFASMDAAFTLSTPTAQCLADVSNFDLTLASKYFSLVSSTLKTADPNHLYLGCKFSINTWIPEALEACAQYADVVSADIYEPVLNTSEWGYTSTFNKPFMVGEFDSGALDEGPFSPGIVPVSSQAARAQTFENYVYSALALPSFVGVNWYAYADQQTTGRYTDGQNGNIGFVSIADHAYPQMAAASRAVAPTIYAFRSNSTQLVVADATGTASAQVVVNATLTRIDNGAPLQSRTVNFYLNGILIGSAATHSTGTAFWGFRIASNALAGNSIITASFAGDSADSASTGMGTLTIESGPPVITVTDISAYAGTTPVLTATVTRADTGEPIQGLSVSFAVNGVSLGAPVVTHSTGIAYDSVKIPSTTQPQVQTIIVSFAGNSSYPSSAGRGTLTVEVLDVPTAISVLNVTGQPGQAVSLQATLTRTDSGAGLQNQTLNFSIGGAVIGSELTHSTGIAYQPYTIPSTAVPGTQTITVSFAGSTSYIASSNTGTLTVPDLPTAVSVAPITGDAGSSVVLTATLTRTDTGAGLANRTLSCSVNGVSIGSETTHSTGIAYFGYTIPATAAAGGEPIVVTFAGDASDQGSSGTGTLTIPMLPTQITVPNVTGASGTTVQLTATLLNADTGGALGGRTLSMTVNGNSAGTGVTNTSGVAYFAYKIPVGTPAGPLTISVQFAGDASDSSSSNTGTLTVTT